MSITTCRECGKNVSSKAKTCPSCGIKNPAMSKNVFSIIGNIIRTIVFFFIGLVVIGFIGAAVFDSSNKAKCELLSRSLKPDLFLIQGEADAGYRYNVRVKNIGEKGEITIVAKLSTSEGEFKREQTLLFDSQEERNLSFTFHEPTVNATNIQGNISYRP